MMQVGDHVKIPDRTSIFAVLALGQDDGRALVEAVLDAPGKCPFSCDLTSLVLVDSNDTALPPA